MGVEIKIDTGPLCRTFEDMIARIEHFKRVDIGMVMSDWQIADMHRGRPFTMRSRAKGIAVTKIRPHSLLEMLKSQGAYLSEKEQRNIVRSVRAMAKKRLGRFAYYENAPKARHRKFVFREHRHWSSRPILRPEMYTRLQAKLIEAMTEKLAWKNPMGKMYGT